MRTWTLFTLAILLLIGSAVGSSQAALSYYSENYAARIQTSNIGVSLTENGKETGGSLLIHMISEETGEKVCPGKVYEERLGVSNTGSVDSYVRVILYQYWEDKDGNKRMDIPSDLVSLNLTGGKWIEDLTVSTEERKVLYYTEILKPGERTPDLSDLLSIDPKILSYVTKKTKVENGYTIFTTTYDYDGLRFVLEAETDAVQTHSGADAAQSAWGVKVSVDADGRLSLSDNGIAMQGETYQDSGGWSVEFTGNQLKSNFKPLDLVDAIYGLQPGDSITVNLMLSNADRSKTDWYMSNQVISSLEDSQKEAKGGAYTYQLSYTDSKGVITALYDSENVGGEKDSSTGPGLHEATDGLEEFFYLDRLAYGGSGQITLKVALDGETQGNAYQDALADLQMRFAVEKATKTQKPSASSGGSVSEVPAPAKPVSQMYTTGSPQTNDAEELLRWSALFALAGGLLLFYVVLYAKKDTGGKNS